MVSHDHEFADRSVRLLLDDSSCSILARLAGQRRIVSVVGELDIAARNEVFTACVAGPENSVVVDLSKTSFMDCSGYAGLVAARLVLEERGGSLELTHQHGEPDRLLRLLGHAAIEDLPQDFIAC